MKGIKLTREFAAATAFLIVVPLVSHLAFSWMGFTPTDEGFTLAHSRRILDGQLPHRDFIIIRPFLSPLIHVPFVLWGGNYTFWLSRCFVWFQLASISWIWTSLGKRAIKFSLSTTITILIALICFAASTHTKHITAWHTIDGLFISAIGFWLVFRNGQGSKFAGYFLIAAAALCKQSFVFIAPVSLIVLGDWRSIKNWVAAILPGAFYGIYLLAAHAVTDGLVQLTAHTELLTAGVVPYVRLRVLFSLVLGFVSCWATRPEARLPDKTKRWAAFALMYSAPLLGVVVSLWFGILIHTAFLLFGFFAGTSLCLLTERATPRQTKQFVLLLLLMAWSVSLSTGYNSPALMAGPILAGLALYSLSILKPGRRLQWLLVGIAAALVVLGFTVARFRYVYRDRAAPELTNSVGEVLAGGGHIYTNANTYAFMLDLDQAVDRAKKENKAYAILPDVAAYWVKAPQQNPLPAIWPHAQELSKRALMNRFIDAMESQRGKTVFIVQKVEAATLARGFVNLENSDYYEVVRYARTRFVKIQETAYFELYE